MKKLITMLSALTITSSIVPLTVACGKDNEVKGEQIELSKITSDMLLDGIKIEDATKNSEIAQEIESNVYKLFVKKLTGIDQKKMEDFSSSKGDLSDSEKKTLLFIQFYFEQKPLI